MKKFTITFETPGGSEFSLMDKCCGVLNSRYPIAFAQVCTLGDFVISDIEDCVDLKF